MLESKATVADKASLASKLNKVQTRLSNCSKYTLKRLESVLSKDLDLALKLS
jgi:hypothetical protein